MMIIAGGIVRPFDRIGERHQVKAAVLRKAEQSRLRALHGCQTDQAGDEQDPGCVRETRPSGELASSLKLLSWWGNTG